MSQKSILLTPDLSKKMMESAKKSPVLLEKLLNAKSNFEKKSASLIAFRKDSK